MGSFCLCKHFWRHKLQIVVTMMLSAATDNPWLQNCATSLKCILSHDSNKLQVAIFHVWIWILYNSNGDDFGEKIDAQQRKKLMKSRLNMIMAINRRLKFVNAYTFVSVYTYAWSQLYHLQWFLGKCDFEKLMAFQGLLIWSAWFSKNSYQIVI